jgi:hypothetical protein
LRHAIAIGEGLSRLGVLLGGPPLSLVDMLLSQLKGVQEHDVPLVVCPSQEGGGSFVFLEMWVVPFRSLYSPFLGCFGFFFVFFCNGWQGFHHFLAIFPQKEKDWYDIEHTSLKGMTKRKKAQPPFT